MNADAERRRSRRQKGIHRTSLSTQDCGFLFLICVHLSLSAVRKNNPFILKLRMLEVQDEANRKFGNAKVIQHLSAFVISNPVNTFWICHYLAKEDQIRDEFPDKLTPVKNLETTLLVKCNVPSLKFDNQRILIKLLVKTMTKLVQHIERTADDRFGLFLARKILSTFTSQIWKIVEVHRFLTADE